MNIRPAKYTKFDPKIDFMYAVDLERENEIKVKLDKMASIPGLNDDERDDLLIEKDLCRVQVRPSQKYVSSQMEEDICNMLYEEVKEIKTLQLLKKYKDFADKEAWKVHEQKSYSTWFVPDFKRYLPNFERYLYTIDNVNEFPDFYRNSAIVFYAVFQKYIRIRKTELSN